MVNRADKTLYPKYSVPVGGGGKEERRNKNKRDQETVISTVTLNVN